MHTGMAWSVQVCPPHPGHLHRNNEERPDMKSPDPNLEADQFGRHPTTPQSPAPVRDLSADDLRQTRPLLVTADPHLLDEVLDLAHRCAADIDVAPDPVTARDRFGSAPVVLVGVDLAEACVRARLPRRPGVIVVGAQRGDEYDPPFAAAERLGAEHIAMLPAGAPWLADRLSTLAAAIPDSLLASQRPQTPTPVPAETRGTLVAVLGGRGGAGATVLACGLAVTAVRLGRRTLVIDGDPFGGGLDLVFGLEGMPGLRWSDLTHTPAAVSIPALAETLPQLGELAVLSCGRNDDPTVPVEAMRAALTAARNGWDLVVVDLPRRFDDATVAALTAVGGILFGGLLDYLALRKTRLI
ncbi:hypothetical protein GCM10009558_107640 [Virgisporangium aurantiacum]